MAETLKRGKLEKSRALYQDVAFAATDRELIQKNH
jgi:hypothetical protein